MNNESHYDNIQSFLNTALQCFIFSYVAGLPVCSTVLFWEYYFGISVAHSKSTGNYLNRGQKTRVAILIVSMLLVKSFLKQNAFVDLISLEQ